MKLAFLFLILSISSAAAISNKCQCGEIQYSNNKCDNIFQDPAKKCGFLRVIYTPTIKDKCAFARITCLKRGVGLQSATIVAKVKTNGTEAEEFSLITYRKLNFVFLTLKCTNGNWSLSHDLEGNTISSPMTIQCATSDGAESFDYIAIDGHL